MGEIKNRWNEEERNLQTVKGIGLLITTNWYLDSYQVNFLESQFLSYNFIDQNDPIAKYP